MNSFLACVGLSLITFAAYHRVKAARAGQSLDRSHEGWFLLVGIRVIGIGLMAAMVGWFLDRSLLHFADVDLPVEVRWAGAILFALAAAWQMWMFRTLGANLTDTVVTRPDAYFVTSGPYRFVRNPMYTGILFLSWGLGIAQGNWVAPVGGTVVFLLLAIRTRIEERFLIARFGDSYRAYMSRVGRFLPMH